MLDFVCISNKFDLMYLQSNNLLMNLKQSTIMLIVINSITFVVKYLMEYTMMVMIIFHKNLVSNNFNTDNLRN